MAVSQKREWYGHLQRILYSKNYGNLEIKGLRRKAKPKMRQKDKVTEDLRGIGC